MVPYDSDNIFAKIISGEIPSDIVYEDEYCLSFEDIEPQAAIHFLIITKGKYVDFGDFVTRASAAEIEGMFKGVKKTAEILGLEQGGYRVLTNKGVFAGQTVLHFHIHLFGGEDLGPMLAKADKHM